MPAGNDSDKAYIGIGPCGCVTFVMVAGYGTKRQEKAELRKVMKDGRRIEITSVGDARKRLTHECDHDAPPPSDDELDRLVAEARP